MDALHTRDDATDTDPPAEVDTDRRTTPGLPGVAVVHRARLATGVAVVAAAMTVAWFARALQTGSATDWLWTVVLAAVAIVQLLVVRDSRAPLLLADSHGVRVRRGETWTGLQWQDIAHVEVQSPASWLRDGKIVVHPRVLEDTEEPSVSPEAFTVPLAATTRLEYDGLTGDLVADLDALASGRTPVLVLTRIEPAAPEDAHEDEDAEDTEDVPAAEGSQAGDEQPEPEQTPVVHSGVEVVVLGGTDTGEGLVLPHQMTAVERDAAEQGTAVETTSESPTTPAPAPAAHFAPVDPVRGTTAAARSETVHEKPREPRPGAPIGEAEAGALPAQRAGTPGPVVVARLDDFEAHRPRPAAEAKIGPLIAAARHRARLSIDTLSERTRIRPHVLECIEVDDFEPCGGDFYARGHLRTLARVFGLDAAELIALYDEHYARPEIEARQVFEAELATGIGGGMRATFAGPRWSILAASVVALAMVWGVAHFFTDQPQEIVSPAPNVDSAGLTHGKPAAAPKSTLAALGVTAVGASPQVVVRDRDGRILWAGQLPAGKHQQVIGLAPFDVTASNGKAVKVSFLGKEKGTVGPSSAADSKQYG